MFVYATVGEVLLKCPQTEWKVKAIELHSELQEKTSNCSVKTISEMDHAFWLRLLVKPTWWISLTNGKDPIATEVHTIQSSIIFIYTVAS